MSAGSDGYPRLRWILACVAVIVLVATLAVTIHGIVTTSLRAGLEDIPYNELTKESIDLRLEFSRSLFEVGLLITAALWGLIIAKKDEAGVVLKDHQEVIMFFSASLLLV